jgi:YrbI family 3-deoxy-D-manno-octulosonate 8-phosphate phosphatase
LEEKKIDIDLSEAAFIGNDIMDVPLMKKVGIKIAVQDAYPELTAIVDYVTSKPGGHGAVREILDLYIKGKGLNLADFLYK